MTNKMENQLLSAEELIEQQSQRKVTLPSLGEKVNHAKRNERESEEVQAKLQNVKSLISKPLVSQRSQISEATWDIDLGLAVVHKQCGKHWEVMGHFRDETLYLRPEEALFLLESNALEIKLNQLSMSIQQSYEVMLGKTCTLDEYRTYAHFSRQGYKVVRHQGDLGISKYEGKIKLDQYRTKKRKKNSTNGKYPSRRKVPKVIDLVDEEDCDVHGDLEPTGDDDIIEIKDDDEDEANVTEIVEESVKNDVTGTRQYFQDVPSLIGLGGASLKTPPTDLLPFRAWPCKKSYDLIIVHDQQGNRIAKRNDRFKMISAGTSTPPSPAPLPHSMDGLITTLNRPFYQKYTPKVKGSKSFKGNFRKVKGRSKWNLAVTIPNDTHHPEVITLSDEDEPETSQVLLEGSLRTLWAKSETVPMLRPLDAKTTRSVLNKLQLKVVEPSEDADEVQDYHISYDIYHPNVHFRKSAPRLPNFRVVIAQKEDRVPNIDDLQCIIGTIKDEVPILFAVPSQSDIAFYSPYPIDLPLDITMG